jgi:hypothetical protein
MTPHEYLQGVARHLYACWPDLSFALIIADDGESQVISSMNLIERNEVLTSITQSEPYDSRDLEMES